jgi:uncharacterized protein YggE
MDTTPRVSSEQSAVYLRIAAVAALMIGAIAALWYVAAYAKTMPPSRTFFSTAESKVVAVPDVAQLTLGVLTEGGKNLAGLQKENSEKANRIGAFLKTQGVQEKDIKTQSYNITPRYQYFSCPPQGRISHELGLVAPCPFPEITGYSITQNITVKISHLDKAGDILAGVVEAGANTVNSLAFTVDDPAKFENQAREEAVAKAREKAKALARAGGFRLGKIISISEGFSPMPAVFAEGAALKEGRGGGDTAPVIEPGSQEIRAEITLTYEMR